MKANVMGSWRPPNVGATNSSGFAGLPGGSRNYLGKFEFIWDGGYWWGLSKYAPYEPFNVSLFFSDGGITHGYFLDGNKVDGLSCRCIKY
jgi:hypothetical protein